MVAQEKFGVSLQISLLPSLLWLKAYTSRSYFTNFDWLPSLTLLRHLLTAQELFDYGHLSYCYLTYFYSYKLGMRSQAITEKLPGILCLIPFFNYTLLSA